MNIPASNSNHKHPMFKKLKSWVGKTLNQIGKAVKGLCNREAVKPQRHMTPDEFFAQWRLRRGTKGQKGCFGKGEIRRRLDRRQHRQLKAMGFNLKPIL